MATCTYNPGVDNYNPYAVLTVTEKSYDVNSNSSVVSWDLKLYRPYSITSSAVKNYSVIVNGATVASGTTTIGGSGTKTIASGTKTITHNSDGKKTISFSFTLDFGITWSGVYIGTGQASGSLALTNIPRVSTFSVNKTSADMGTAVTFTITRGSTAFTHKLTLTWGGVTTTIASNVATSQAWTIPLTLADDLPNSTSGACVITCITYNGSSEIGRKTLAMTLNVPASVKPVVNNIVVSEATSGLASKFGAYVQGHSKLKVVTTASGSYSSTIKSYSVKISGKTYNGSTITSDAILTSGSVAVDVTVTDSRGRTATSTVNVTVLAYSHPTITALTAQRCDSNGTINDDGEYVKLSYAFDITTLGNKNDKSYTLAYKLKSAADFTNLTSGSDYSVNTSYIPSTVFSGDEAYDFRLTVSDYFNEISFDSDVPTAFTLMDFLASGNGMAIGKVANKANTLEIALDVEFTGKVRGAIFDAIYPVGSIYLAYNHVNPATLFGGTWTRIENAFLWASSASDTIGVTGGEETHTLTVNEMPRHKHNVGAYKSTDGNGATIDAYTALVSSSNGSDTTNKYYTSGTLSVGNSQPHNNMPPYIQVSVWRRTA